MPSHINRKYLSTSKSKTVGMVYSKSEMSTLTGRKSYSSSASESGYHFSLISPNSNNELSCSFLTFNGSYWV